MSNLGHPAVRAVAGAVVLLLAGTLLGRLSPAADPYLAAALVVFAVVLIVSFVAARRRPQASSPAVDQSVKSYGQTGGITARNVTTTKERPDE
jgi:hypothetical protein